jgi:subtilisin family serine protease
MLKRFARLLLVPLLVMVASGEEARVLVTFRDGFAPDAARARLRSMGLPAARSFDAIAGKTNRAVMLIRRKDLTTGQLIERLRRDPQVLMAEPDALRHLTSTTPPNDTWFSRLWGLQNTGQTLNGVTGTAGVDIRYLPAMALRNPNANQEIVIGVIDSGFDVKHPDLSPQLWVNAGEIPGNGIDDDANGYIDDIHGYDFFADTAVLDDSGSHGTHVAGTILATGSNQQGITGVDPLSRLLCMKVSNDGTTIYISSAIEAMNYAVQLKNRGVNIVAINASYTGDEYSNSERIATEGLRDAGIILCCAAGNDNGLNLDNSPRYPAAYPTSNIISIAALTSTNQLASYSNIGVNSVDIAAPGSTVYSLMPVERVATTRSLVIDGTSYPTAHITYSGLTASISGQVVACGIGNPGDFPPSVQGNIALIQRGTLNFSVKTANAKAAGAVAAIIYDHTLSGINDLPPWTLGSSGDWIPVLRITNASGLDILSRWPTTATLSITRDTTNAYQYLNGTSMATPHVTGAVAFAARNFPSETVVQRVARILNNTVPVAALSGKTVTGGRLDLLNMIDTDSDQLPDWWETQHLGNLAATAAQDADTDGLSNAVEFFYGTTPTGFDAIPLTNYQRSGNQFSLQFPTISGANYQVEWSGSMHAGTWLPLGAVIAGTGSTVNVADVTSDPRRFYRVRRSVP